MEFAEITKRIEELIENRGTTVNSLCDNIRVPQSTMSQQMNGKRALSLSTITKILDYMPDLSAEWLLRGTGDMFISNENSSYDGPTDREKSLMQLNETYISTINHLNKVISMLESQMGESQKKAVG